MKLHYRTLEVPEGAPLDVVRRGYHKVSKQYHPDKEGGSNDKFVEIQHAYDRLAAILDPKKANA